MLVWICTHWGNNLHAGTIAAEGSLDVILIAGCNSDAVNSVIKLLWSINNTIK